MHRSSAGSLSLLIAPGMNFGGGAAGPGMCVGGGGAGGVGGEHSEMLVSLGEANRNLYLLSGSGGRKDEGEGRGGGGGGRRGRRGELSSGAFCWN